MKKLAVLLGCVVLGLTMVLSAMAADNQTFNLHGTVVHKDLEGGFFAIESDEGQVYDPINLPDRFKKHGLKVNVTAILRNDMGSIHMVGDVIEIVDIDVE